LRERKEDIPVLVEHFIEKYATPLRIERPAISDKAMELLKAYDWPGNVRELQNCIYSAMTVAESSVIDAFDLPKRVYLGLQRPQTGSPASGRMSLAQIVVEATAEAEREAISRALLEAGGNREKAAESLGIGRQTLYRKLKLYGME